jgi:hypothetical protein
MIGLMDDWMIGFEYNRTGKRTVNYKIWKFIFQI